MLHIHKISKQYDGSDVLFALSLDLKAGQAHGLLGANGAGKSTLIKIIMGLVFADQGQVPKNEHISLLPENPYLPLNLSALQMVNHACRTQQSNKSAQDLLNEVQLKQEAWSKPIRTYSKGMRQRTSIAYALAANPEWLILDEPMSGLDAMGRKQMLELFEDYKQQGVSMLMCSHSVTDLVRLCNQVHIMAQGKMCESIAIEEHSMQEAALLEQRLMVWSDNHVVD